jgi:hypothetical protein
MELEMGRALFVTAKRHVSAIRTVIVLASVGVCAATAQAQESVNSELDKCVRKEQGRAAAKGAMLGALAGLIKSAGDNNSDTGKNVLAGAAIGGAAGFATAYFTAVNTCYKKNPSWVPETQLQRGASYEQAKSAVGYTPSMGVLAKAVGTAVPATVQPGQVLPLDSRFIALTPDGAEVELLIERRLFAIYEGKETQVPFPGVDREQRKVEAGEQTDPSKIILPPDMPVGTALRYEFSVAVAGKQPSVVTAQTVVN